MKKTEFGVIFSKDADFSRVNYAWAKPPSRLVRLMGWLASIFTKR